jgi:hypothetical protein
MIWMLCLCAFLSGWIVGGSVTDFLNRKLIDVQRDLIAAYRLDAMSGLLNDLKQGEPHEH